MLRAFSLERISGQKTDDLHNEEIKIAENWFYQIVRPKKCFKCYIPYFEGFSQKRYKWFLREIAHYNIKNTTITFHLKVRDYLAKIRR